MIEAELENGTVLEFPDGTSDDTIEKALRIVIQEQRESGILQEVDEQPTPGKVQPDNEERFLGGMQLFPTSKQMIENLQTPQPESIAQVTTPVLQGLGMAGGFLLGGGPTPFGAAGSALGFGAGDIAAKAVETQLGIRQAPMDVESSIVEGLESVQTGFEAELLGAGLANIVRGTGKLISKGKEKAVDFLVKNMAN